MTMGTLVAGLLGHLISHLTGQHTFTLSAYSLQKTSISLPRRTDMKSQPCLPHGDLPNIALCIRQSVLLQQMKTPMHLGLVRPNSQREDSDLIDGKRPSPNVNV